MSEPIPRRPERPDEEMCCRRGCDPCIFDYYERALDRWEARVRAMGLDPEALPAAAAGVTPKA
ncbi:oxidoreductase-like domain-containing protein [Phenylobacterium sp.]|uniref:oxidoreductase-like domain-containing protein n=1 Tax=Phenylobacterium sp. TaxID=1871053 RepID=UPI002BF621E4|nr:oxidoreductase-like domain-containing protein [Phenylobacterium sp.]